MNSDPQTLTKSLGKPSNFGRLFVVILLVAVVAGAGTGMMMAKSAASTPSSSDPGQTTTKTTAKSAAQDRSTFKDFETGKITKKVSTTTKTTNDYSEGTHLLIRQSGTPVALTSSVVDLSLYEGKNVTVYGQTQKALKEGWLMDVGLVEEKQ